MGGPPHARVRIEGHEFAYQRLGRGPPLLLVHGITTWSFIWERMLGPLSEHHEVVAVDLLGCGRSDKPDEVSYALRDHARRMGLLIDALGLGPVHYVGHDLGGGIGQIVSVRSPEKLRSLTMINTVAYDFWPVQPIIALRTPIIRWFLVATFDAGTLRFVVRRGLHHKERLTDELLASFREPLLSEGGRRAFLHFARCLDNGDLTGIAAELRRGRVPATIIWGKRDAYLPFAAAEALAAGIPGCRLVPVETAGHYSPIDEPELLARLVSEATGDR
jgi:pimeloyl-ACP methyl ester carboxylesterase